MTLHVDKHGGFLSKPGAKPSSNQVLFLVHALWEMHLAGEDVKPLLAHFHSFMLATSLGGGRFSRKPKDKRTNSHDNFLGMAAGVLLWRLVRGKHGPWKDELLKLGKRGWNHGKLSLKDSLQPWKLLETQLKPDNIGFIKLCCGKQPNALERKAMKMNAELSDSWNLHRLRGICLAALNVEKSTLKILKGRVNYDKAMLEYYGKSSVVTEAMRANKGVWKRGI